MMQDVPAAPKEDAIMIFMDITIDLPAEIAEQLELLGICVFETCRFHADTRRMTASVATTLYRKGM